MQKISFNEGWAYGHLGADSLVPVTLPHDAMLCEERREGNPGGTVVTLKAALRDGGADTGRWTWDDDPSCTSPVREVVLDTSTPGWYQVLFSSGGAAVTGWVSADYLALL